MTITGGRIRVVLHRESDWRRIRPHVASFTRWGIYATLKDCRVAEIEPSELAGISVTLKEGLAHAIRVAAKARSKTTWGASHSAGVVEHLESVTGSVLPRPRLDVAYVDAYVLQQQFEAFRRFVSMKSGVPFRSFAADPYVEGEEGYKRDVLRQGRGALEFSRWKASEIGTGRIIDRTIRAIELRDNNLVPWRPRYGEALRPHQVLYESRTDGARRKEIERSLFELYRGVDDEARFMDLRRLLGARYPLLAYLFFLRDPSRYLPLAPSTFDEVFRRLGIDFKTAHECAWSNYMTFLDIVSEVRELLRDWLESEVDLLDAHSFLWMLARQMKKEDGWAETGDYFELPETERQAITKARIGQGPFRQRLIEFWGSRCAVTGCATEDLLLASHIKPWCDAEPLERIDQFNGLLLSPSLDRCFDRGYVSFDDDGQLLISPCLRQDDLVALGIEHGMRLRRIDGQHRRFLEYHRARVFQRR